MALARFEEKRAFFASGATRDYGFRVTMLRRLKDAIKARESAIADALAADFGKPRLESHLTEIGILYEEIDHAVRRLKGWMRPERISARLALFPTRYEVTRVPKGVVLIVGPWNYPFQLAMNPLVAAIAAGNCAVVKPSHVTARVAGVIASIIEESLPPGLASAVPGPGSQVVPALLERYRFDHVFFTGSPAVGRDVATRAAATHTPVTLELGGKSPVIVGPGADPADAARRIVWAKCVNAGQTCIAPDYALVHRPLKEAFVREATKAVREFFGDDPKASPDLARIINDRRFETVRGYLRDARIISGGRSDPAERYIEPTLIDEPSLDAPVMREEIFGPVLPVLAFDGIDDAIGIVERNPYPLALYLFCKDRDFRDETLARVRFGGGCVGNALVHVSDPRVPFGGVGPSGQGRYHGKYGFDEFSHARTVAYSGRGALNRLVFAPYTDAMSRRARRLMG